MMNERGRGRPLTKRSDDKQQQQQPQQPQFSSSGGSSSSNTSNSGNSSNNVSYSIVQPPQRPHHRQQQQQQQQQRQNFKRRQSLDDESDTPACEKKVELGDTFEQHRALLSEVYTMASRSNAHQQLLASHPELTDPQLEELAKLVVKATEEGHSHLSLFGQVDPAAAAVALMRAYGRPFQHRLDSLLMQRLAALQSRARRSRERNCVTGFDEQFANFLGHLAAAGVETFRVKAAVYLLTVVDEFLSVQLASIDRWRRAIMPLHEHAGLLLAAELRAASPAVEPRLRSIGQQLALAETDRFMAGAGCMFVRPMLAEVLEKLRTEGLLAYRQ